MKRMGRKNRAYYRICATDKRSPRDGRVIEELGTYDTSVPDTDARVTLDNVRLEYWLSVGAKPSDAVKVLIKKYGAKGTHVKEMELARAKLKLPRIIPESGAPVFVPEVKSTAAAVVAVAPIPPRDSHGWSVSFQPLSNAHHSWAAGVDEGLCGSLRRRSRPSPLGGAVTPARVFRHAHRYPHPLSRDVRRLPRRESARGRPRLWAARHPGHEHP
ncbi:MAG: 30S ribosomal protein S16 [Planctomycetota bacterium]|nr:30S ribosomal protein S16 [Planctomycetota bacterium]